VATRAVVYEVVLTQGAEQDLEALFDHVAEHDSVANAHRLLDNLMDVAQSLSKLPERGSRPKELLAVGIQQYRQVFFKPYRVIYRLHGKQAVIYLIADGRRDMPALLTRRLLGHGGGG
jgi:toxin ParE1/3/4